MALAGCGAMGVPEETVAENLPTAENDDETWEEEKRFRTELEKVKRIANPKQDPASWSIKGLATKVDLKALIRFGQTNDTMPRLVSPETTPFRKHYISGRKLAVIKNAHRKLNPARYQIAALVEEFRNEYFCLDDNHDAMLQFGDFVQYMKNTQDDDPLMIFDCDFENRYSVAHKRKGRLSEYAVPDIFAGDSLFSLVECRPPWRWLIVAPKRSGTEMHVDPLGTCAWNTLLEGLKLWAILPVEAGKHYNLESECNMWAALWFIEVGMAAAKLPEDNRPTFVLQRPGETIFVPAGRYHVVLNLTDTVAITENFASEFHFDDILRVTVKKEPEFCEKFFQRLREERNDLAERAMDLCSKESKHILQKWAKANLDCKKDLCHTADVKSTPGINRQATVDDDSEDSGFDLL